MMTLYEAAKRLEAMEHPSVATILRRHGYAAEADAVERVTAAVRDLDNQRQQFMAGL